MGSNGIFKSFDQRFGNGWRGGVGKAGAASLAYIGIEGKLGDDEHLSANIEKRTIHLAFIVSKDAQMDNFISQNLYLNLAIVLSYSKQHQKPLTYLADNLLINSYTSPAYPL